MGLKKNSIFNTRSKEWLQIWSFKPFTFSPRDQRHYTNEDSQRCRPHVSAQDTYFFQNGETFLGKPINDFSFPLTSCSTILPSCLLCQHFNLSVKYTFLTWNDLEENATPEFFLGQGWEETMFWESRTSNIWRNILAPKVTEMFKVLQNP